MVKIGRFWLRLKRWFTLVSQMAACAIRRAVDDFTLGGVVLLAVMVALVLILVLAVCASIWTEIRYPCLRSEKYECEAQICTYYDGGGNCQAWIATSSACFRCVERTP